MPMPVDIAALVARKSRLPIVASTARSTTVVMDGYFSFEVKGEMGETVSMGNAKPYAFLPLGDPIRDRVVGYAKVDDSAVMNGGKYSDSVALVFLEGEVTTPFHEGGLNLCLRELGKGVHPTLLGQLCMAILTEDRKWHCVSTTVMHQLNGRREPFLCSVVNSFGTFTIVNHADIKARESTTVAPPMKQISPLADTDVPLEIVIPVAIGVLLIMIGVVIFFLVIQPRRQKRRDAERQADVEALERIEAANKSNTTTVAIEKEPEALTEFVGGAEALEKEKARHHRRHHQAHSPRSPRSLKSSSRSSQPRSPRSPRSPPPEPFDDDDDSM